MSFTRYTQSNLHTEGIKDVIDYGLDPDGVLVEEGHPIIALIHATPNLLDLPSLKRWIRLERPMVRACCTALINDGFGLERDPFPVHVVRGISIPQVARELGHESLTSEEFYKAETLAFKSHTDTTAVLPIRREHVDGSDVYVNVYDYSKQPMLAQALRDLRIVPGDIGVVD